MSEPRDIIDLLPRTLGANGAKGEALQEVLEDFVTTQKDGVRVPSERAIAHRYGLARMTVRREIERLAANGLVYRGRRGTYVAGRRVVLAARLTSFSEDMRARGLEPGGRPLVQRVVPATLVVAEHLEVEPGTPTVQLERLRTADGEAMAVERAHLPAERFAGLLETDLRGESLYDLLERHFGVEIAYADQTVKAVVLASEQAALLGVPRGRPALLFERTSRDAAGAVFEYVRSWYRGDRYEVALRLTRLSR